MAYMIRYHRAEASEGEAESYETLEEARRLVNAKAADLDCRAEFAIIFRISPSGTEELEESTRLRA